MEVLHNCFIGLNIRIEGGFGLFKIMKILLSFMPERITSVGSICNLFKSCDLGSHVILSHLCHLSNILFKLFDIQSNAFEISLELVVLGDSGVHGIQK